MNHNGATGNYNATNFLAGLEDVTSAAEEETADILSINLRPTPIRQIRNGDENETKPIHYASASDMEPRKKLENFTCFPRLSVELRLKIWRTIAFMPRVVALREQTRHDQNPKRQVSIQMTSAAAKLLQINHESRVEGLRFYKPCFGPQLSGDISVADVKDLVIHANLTVDTLYLERFCYQSFWQTRVESRSSRYMDNFIRHASSIAIDACRASEGGYIDCIFFMLKCSPNIKEVLLVVRINDNLINRTLSGHWDLLEFHKDEASCYREKYQGDWTIICDALGSRFTNPRKVVTLSDPEIRIVGLTRDGVRI
ncbi:predicted protein [Sclerotinia sclerotiorum 1980 UF-70]|uniref:2EXR domain-containing protein n=2 Tax=Sclerotinia sclerotiorum (strain ATCC 18683 / 1980 / Ss-1) TaxID=665079 RepID=A7F9Q5_SCLS1|nr:predicted protein [Sclerotinia sclerotiorum 1980 UF-70]APA16328.1 hypothetical protein sscle_16g110980 [Sclerotinia sclerotiorum 1980 UF-70]EDO00466.1 predicted protein [Sclerotinia sclerotiorum 1980 UF-70]